MEEVWDDKTYKVTAPSHQAAGCDIWPIMKLFYPLQDPLTGFIPDIRMIAEDL
jgi:hypothetical protein